MKINKRIFHIIAPIVKTVAKELEGGARLKKISVTEDVDLQTREPCIDILITFKKGKLLRVMPMRMLIKEMV